MLGPVGSHNLRLKSKEKHSHLETRYPSNEWPGAYHWASVMAFLALGTKLNQAYP